jgi:excinuclease UvrABC nuclease subunit
MKKFDLENIKTEFNKSGYYKLYNKDKKVIYTGSSKRIQNRLLSVFYGRSDNATNENKKKVRKLTIFYSVEYTTLKKARQKDRDHKAKYNIY